MFFNKGNFEVELRKLTQTINVPFGVTEFTGQWSNITGEKADEVVYLISSPQHSKIMHIVIHSSLDVTTGKSINKASGVVLGFLFHNNYLGDPDKYSEFKRIKRTIRLSKHLKEAVDEALKVVIGLDGYDNYRGMQWRDLNKPHLQVAEFGRRLSEKYKVKLTGIPNGTNQFRGKLENGEFIKYNRQAKSLNGDSFVAYVVSGILVSDLVVDTESAKVVKALDYKGRDVSNKFAYVATVQNGLVAEDENYSKWFIKQN